MRRPYNRANLASITTTEETIYSYASSAYLATKIEGDNTEIEGDIKEDIEESALNNKIIIKKPNSFILEPKSYKEAISDNNPYKPYWLRSMQRELNTLETNKTWELISEIPISSNTSNPTTITPIKTR
jgi:hypothetical protein